MLLVGSERDLQDDFEPVDKPLFEFGALSEDRLDLLDLSLSFFTLISFKGNKISPLPSSRTSAAARIDSLNKAKKDFWVSTWLVSRKN